MQKAIFTLILNTIFSGMILSQVYHPLIRENVYWTINHGNSQFICNLENGDKYYFQGDTIVNSVQYKILRAHPLYQTTPGWPYCAPFAVNYGISDIKRFMREDTMTRQVFTLDIGGGNSEYLLYDFSLNAGDTTLDNYVIDSVGVTILDNGDVRKIWYTFEGFFIESIGGSEGLLMNMSIGLGFWDIPMCVTENDTILWGDECSSILPTKKIEQPEAIKVYLTASQNILFVERENAETEKFQLFDLYGRLVLEKEIQHVFEAIDLPKLAQGVYIYVVGEQRGRMVIGN